jgi:protein-S-isoprenylcysteine O-methyltransferase Ste14
MQKRNTFKVVTGFLIFLIFPPALLFISAGTFNWPMAWLHTLLSLVATLGSRLIVFRRNPDTLRERARFTASEGTKSWDRILVVIGALFGPAAVMIVAGLDFRFGWSGIVSETVQYLSALILALGYGVAVWAMVVNRFFSAVARIQLDRGQTVVTTGPYRIVRHPSYAGGLVASLALPLMLNALWALLPTVAIVIVLIIRTALEDKMLREELPGYGDYAEKTAYRLIPGLW